MRSFGDGSVSLAAVPGPLVRSLAVADVGRGLEGLHRAQQPSLLEQLALRSRVQSITASSALEGVVVPDQARADRIIRGSAHSLRTRSEQELAGYRDGLDYLCQSDWAPLNVGLLLHLHRLLLGHTATPGGSFKASDNLVVDRLPDGTREVRFRPVSARETPWYVDELVTRFEDERHRDRQHPLVLIGLFTLDLLVIHPFEDGNGRVARLVTNALLAQAGYGVARYVSLEQLVAESDDAYYATLLASTHGWHEGRHDPRPWLGYFVTQVGHAYELLAARAAAGATGPGKRERVTAYVLDQAPATFRISHIRAAVPGVSDATIRNALDDLRREGRVEVDGTGRGAAWRRRSPA